MECELPKDKCKVDENISSRRNWAVEVWGASGSLQFGQGVTKCTSVYDRAHCFAGEVESCPHPGWGPVLMWAES